MHTWVTWDVSLRPWRYLTCSSARTLLPRHPSPTCPGDRLYGLKGPPSDPILRRHSGLVMLPVGDLLEESVNYYFLIVMYGGQNVLTEIREFSITHFMLPWSRHLDDRASYAAAQRLFSRATTFQVQNNNRGAAFCAARSSRWRLHG